MNITAMKQALEALENSSHIVFADIGKAHLRDAAITALRAAIEAAEQQGAVAWMYVNVDGECEQIDSVRQMRDVQGMDGTWNCNPYMHGLYNGLEFAVSLLEQREPQFKDAPEKWLSDLPEPRIFSATEAAHGIKEKA